MQLIFERIVPCHSRGGCVECSLSAFRKLKTPLAETTAQSRFSRRRFCLRVLSIKKKKKKTFLDHVCRRVFHGYSRPPRSLSISKFNAWDKSAERATLLENFAIYWLRVYFSLSLSLFFFILFAPVGGKKKAKIIRLISMNLINVTIVIIFI